jgi:hypothetical protein
MAVSVLFHVVLVG